MIYRELNATFGKLNEETLTLHDGLNIVYGPNGSGKSTWSAFLRVMLYGLSTREQSKLGFLADKEKYKPWSGLPMYGKLKLTVGGRPLTVERTAGKNGLLSTMTAVYEDTGRSANLPEPPGEALLGMKREVFERSVFTAQGALAVSDDKDGEFARKLTSLIQTGDADASFSAAKSRLEKWRRAQRYQKSGVIPELERALRDALARREELNRAEEETAVLLAKKEAMEREISQISALAEDEKKEKLRLAEDALIRAEQKLDALPSEELLAELEGVLARDVSHETIPSLLLALGVAAAVGIGVGLLRSWLWGAGAFAAAFVLTAFAKILLKNRKKHTKIEKILHKIDAEATVSSAASVLERERARAEQLRREVVFAEERLVLLSRDVKPEELEALQKELVALTLRCGRPQGRSSANETRAELDAKIESLREEILRAEGEYAALALAIETLCEVNGEMERNFAPILEQAAGRLLHTITDGQFSVVEWSGSEGSLAVREHPAAPPRRILSLSKGTLDELYLCLRLAICTSVLGGEESVPLVLDDVFAFCDEERLCRMLTYLKELAKTRQIILFTCHKREALLLQGDSEVHTVQLG